jgi:hypothetical protein
VGVVEDAATLGFWISNPELGQGRRLQGDSGLEEEPRLRHSKESSTAPHLKKCPPSKPTTTSLPPEFKHDEQRWSPRSLYQPFSLPDPACNVVRDPIFVKHTLVREIRRNHSLNHNSGRILAYFMAFGYHTRMFNDKLFETFQHIPLPDP